MSRESTWCQFCCGNTAQVSVTAAAQIARVTKRTIYLWAIKGRLHAQRENGERLRICQVSLNLATSQVVQPVNNNSIDGRVKLVIMLVEQQYVRNNPTLGEMAKHAHLSSWHLARLFKKNTGSHFGEYLRNLRLKKAEKLLEDPTLSIKEIAAAVGYKYVSDFDHHFKTTYGMKPGEFRRTQQQSENERSMYSQ